jgi:hypothetical protein
MSDYEFKDRQSIKGTRKTTSRFNIKYVVNITFRIIYSVIQITISINKQMAGFVQTGRSDKKYI